MAKVTNVEEFVAEQTQLRVERRTSQHVYFLNKSPSFVTYYHVNRNLSTSEFTSHTIDSYVGKDSPIRFDKISKMPIYGLPVFDNESEFDENLGTNGEGWTGEGTIVPGVLEPVEGDFMIIEYFNKRALFMMDNVRESTIKAKPHFTVSFHIENVEKIAQLEKQVVSHHTAIFENIGTENRVIMENDNFKTVSELRKYYREVYDYYNNIFLDSYVNTYMITGIEHPEGSVNMIDKYLIKFLSNNRICVLDTVLKEYKMVDYNGINVDEEMDGYKNSLFFAIENKRVKFFKSSDRIVMNHIVNPFAVYSNAFENTPMITSNYDTLTNDNKDEMLSTSIGYDFIGLYDKIKYNNTAVVEDDDLSLLHSIIVKYLNNTDIDIESFKDLLFLDITKLDQYMLFPLILFIMRTIISEKEVDMANYLTTQ